MFKRVGLEAVKLIESQLDEDHGECYSYPDFLRKRGSILNSLWWPETQFVKTFPLILATTAAAAGQSVVWWLEHKTSLRVARTKGNVSIMAATSPDKSLCFTYNIQTHVHTHTHICDMPRRCWNKVHIISARPTTRWMTKSNIKESSMLMQSFIGWCMPVSKVTSGPPVWDPFEALISISGWEFQDNPCPTSGSPIWESYQSWSEPPTFWHAQPGPANTRGVYLMDILIAQEKEVNKRGH